jgi:hypothetical protein
MSRDFHFGFETINSIPPIASIAGATFDTHGSQGMEDSLGLTGSSTVRK